MDLKQNSDTGYERLEDVKADLLKKSPSNLLIQLIEAVRAGIPPPSTALNNEKKTQVDHPAGDSSPVNDAGRPDQLKIFISYAHNDQDYFDVFFPELSSNCREPVIWVDRKIPVGSDWFSEIQNAIDTSAMAILLVSPSFLGSNFIMEHEWKRLTAVRNSNPKFALVPILFRDVNISRIEHLNGIQFFNASGEKYQVFSHKGQLLPFAQLCEFGKNGVLPNPNRDTYFKYLMEVIYKNLGHAISRGAP